MNTMPPRLINSLNTDEVVSAKMIEAYVGTPSRRLLIFTGIALVGFESGGQLDGQEITIDLNARSNTTTPEFTATVGLASIYAGETDELLFATDDVKVTAENLELRLVVNIAALGDPAALNRFAYQAMVYLDPENGKISGSIRWNPHFMIFNAAMELDMFKIEALSTKYQPGSATAGGLGIYTQKVEGLGHTPKPPVLIGGHMEIHYEINNLPIETALSVLVEAKPEAFLVLNTDSNFIFTQISGSRPIKLNKSHLTENPVDFEATGLQKGPR